MARWFETDWEGMFRLEMSLPEIFIRGTLVYLAVILLLRLVLKRQPGKVSLSDLLVVTIIAGVCRNPLVGQTKSIPDGILVVATVLVWSLALDWLSYYVSWFRKLLQPPATLLIENGRMQHDNLRRELMTEDQLKSKLRKNGVTRPEQVAEAWMESDGHVSVIRKQRGTRRTRHAS